MKEVHNWAPGDSYLYALEVADDLRQWRTAIDYKEKGRDSPDDYEVLPRAIRARYLRVRNIHSPYGAKFSISGLRVFGKGDGALPSDVSGVSAKRSTTDGRDAEIHWNASKNAEFYIVRLGTNENELSLNYQVYNHETSLVISSLNLGISYFVSVDAVNEAGIATSLTKTKLP